MRPRKAPMPMPNFALVERVEAGPEIGACEEVVMDRGVSERVMNDMEVVKEETEKREIDGDLGKVPVKVPVNPPVENKVY